MYMNRLREAAKKLTLDSQEINEALTVWETDVYKVPEQIICDLFVSCMTTVVDDFQIEYKKVCLLNQVYSTFLSSGEVFDMAKYLTENYKQLNEYIHAGEECAVALITTALSKVESKKEKTKNCYVFATKYCSFAECADSSTHINYPIYDSYMGAIYKEKRSIWTKELSKDIPNSIFSSYFEIGADINNRITTRYKLYKEAVGEMYKVINKDHPEIDSIKKMDQYLWMALKLKNNTG